MKSLGYTRVILLVLLCPFLWAQEELTLVKEAPAEPVDEVLILGHDVPNPDGPVYQWYGPMVFRIMDLGNAKFGKFITLPHATVMEKHIFGLMLSDGDTSRFDGSPEPKIYFNGCIHPREWIAAEVLLRIAEDLVEQADSDNPDKDAKFLLENLVMHYHKRQRIGQLDPDEVLILQRAERIISDVKR